MALLEGRVALITGAGRGIGRAISLALAAEGAAVALTARSGEELEAVASTIRGSGGRAVVLPTDLGEPDAPQRLVAVTQDQLGAVDILVNNAGVGSSANPKPVAEFDDDFWEHTLLLNLTVPYRLCKAVLPAMRERRNGRILMTASINGKLPSFHGAAYAASKHGLLGLTRTLAMEVAKEGITVNAICPGPVRTEMNDRRIAYDAERRGMDLAELEASLTPIGRRLEPEEIAPLAVYLASPAAACVTGQAINIDGGLCLS